MIGLGSNRLTVCRRGGMSVTQAGRGGMEWLAGGRLPSWASPYSAQATAALLAQFPTQWPTIWDYGFAHPEIVGYMNAYAPEDAKIAYSLVDGIGTRWIVGTGTQWIETSIKAKSTYDYELKVKDAPMNGQWLFGSRDLYNSGQNTTSLILVSSTQIRCYKNSDGDSNIRQNVSVYTGSVSFKSNNRTYSFNGTNYNYGALTHTICNNPIFIFAANFGTTKSSVAAVKLGLLKIVEGENGIAWFVPFIRKINGVDVNGMIDVLSGTFYQNAGSGSFTISETPPS